MSGHALRKAVRFLHLAVNGAWLGAVLCCLLLVAVGSPQQPEPYLSAFWLHDNVVIWVAGVVLFTGLYFSLYAPWGLARKWWIVAKWIGLAVLAVGIPFLVTPAVNTLAAHGDLVLATGQVDPALAALETRALAWIGAEALLLILLFVVSTWRPGGETGLRWEEKRFVRLSLISFAVLTVGASVFSSTVLERARHTPLPRTSAAGLADGPCEATLDWLGTKVAVQVQIQDGRIRTLGILQQPAGLYPELGALVVKKIEAQGDLEVDGISGATTSARGLLVAASAALTASDTVDPVPFVEDR